MKKFIANQLREVANWIDSPNTVFSVSPTIHANGKIDPVDIRRAVINIMKKEQCATRFRRG